MPNNADDFASLFIERTHHRRILVDGGDTHEGSRVGGKPPAPLAATPPRCPVCSGPLRYVLTLAGDTLGEEIAHGKAVSLLACRDYDCLATSHKLTDPSSTVLVVHDDAPRAIQASELDTVTEGRKLTLGEATPDPIEDGYVTIDASKLGGRPGYVQAWGPKWEAKAAERGGGFFFQWSESSFATSGIESGPFTFDGGVVYVFSRIDPAMSLPELADLGAFWQSS